MKYKYTAEDWRIMESSFAEIQQYLMWAEAYGIPKGEERKFLKTVCESFTIMVEIIYNLKGDQIS